MRQHRLDRRAHGAVGRRVVALDGRGRADAEAGPLADEGLRNRPRCRGKAKSGREKRDR